ncbi:hypothetical protein [Effusibacillus consociatus]|uniref:Uncharacterized protein n=1 Tax=Effusibacillus consociatus TaxID=1117041 RepID=A0ABV9Q2Z8_9BACL
MQQVIWSFRYSLEGALKRILYENGNPLSEEELAIIVAEEYSFREQRSRETLRMRIHKALNAPHGAFVQDGQKWTLRQLESDELHNEVYALFQYYRCPFKQGEVLRMLQQRTQRSKGELMSRVDLERDWRFARLEEGDWVLTEWELDSIDDSLEPVKGEATMNQHEDLVTLVAAEIEGYLTQLQQRDQEIPKEVIEKFNSEDLRSIERLMGEKKRIAGFIDDLQQLVNKWSQQKEPVNV